MKRFADNNSRLVYSTATGRTCPECSRPLDRCDCGRRSTPTVSTADGIVRVSRSTKGRKGKGVTVVSGMALDAPGLKQVAKTLKQKTGSGGTVKAGNIEIQGDNRDVIMAELQAMGYTVRRSGG